MSRNLSGEGAGFAAARLAHFPLLFEMWPEPAIHQHSAQVLPFWLPADQIPVRLARPHFGRRKVLAAVSEGKANKASWSIPSMIRVLPSSIVRT